MSENCSVFQPLMVPVYCAFTVHSPCGGEEYMNSKPVPILKPWKNVGKRLTRLSEFTAEVQSDLQCLPYQSLNTLTQGAILARWQRRSKESACQQSYFLFLKDWIIFLQFSYMLLVLNLSLAVKREINCSSDIYKVTREVVIEYCTASN